jgi:hypothetical protein
MTVRGNGTLVVTEFENKVLFFEYRKNEGNDSSLLSVEVDMNGDYPKITKSTWQNGDSLNVLHFLGYIKLHNQVEIPSRFVRSSYGGSESRSLGIVHVWKFLDLGERLPQVSDFDIDIDDGTTVFGMTSRPTNNLINLFELEEKIATDPVVSSQVSIVDGDTRGEEVEPQSNIYSNSMVLGIFLLALVLFIVKRGFAPAKFRNA